MYANRRWCAYPCHLRFASQDEWFGISYFAFTWRSLSSECLTGTVWRYSWPVNPFSRSFLDYLTFRDYMLLNFYVNGSEAIEFFEAFSFDVQWWYFWSPFFLVHILASATHCCDKHFDNIHGKQHLNILNFSCIWVLASLDCLTMPCYLKLKVCAHAGFEFICCEQQPFCKLRKWTNWWLQANKRFWASIKQW